MKRYLLLILLYFIFQNSTSQILIGEKEPPAIPEIYINSGRPNMVVKSYTRIKTINYTANWSIPKTNSFREYNDMVFYFNEDGQIKRIFEYNRDENRIFSTDYSRGKDTLLITKIDHTQNIEYYWKKSDSLLIEQGELNKVTKGLIKWSYTYQNSLLTKLEKRNERDKLLYLELNARDSTNNIVETEIKKKRRKSYLIKYEYNCDNKPIRIESYKLDDSLKLEYTFSFQYDSLIQKSDILVGNIKRNKIRHVEQFYDSNDRVIEKVFYNRKKSNYYKEKYYYDKNDNLISQENYIGEDLDKSFIITFDEFGNAILIQIYLTDFLLGKRLMYQETRKYGVNNNIVRIETFDGFKKISSYHDFRYEFE